NDNNNTNSRDIHKAGWLQYLPYADRPSTSATGSSVAAVANNEHRFWVVFSVVNESQPYLEFYQKRQPLPHLTSQLSTPVSKHSLSRCQHIAPAIVLSSDNKLFNEFAVTLDRQILRLVADSEHSMYDWIDCLKLRLRQLNVLPAQDNLYMREPQPLPRTASIRRRLQHCRPLPPIPMPSGSAVSGTSSGPNTPTSLTGSPTIHPNTPTTPVAAGNLRAALINEPLTPIASTSTAVLTAASPAHPRAESPKEIYETIFNTRSQPPLPQRTIQRQQSTSSSTGATTTTLAALINTNGANNNNSNTLETPLNSSAPVDEGPPPYESVSTTDLSQTPVSLRESQVLRLRKEIAHQSGVRLMVRKKDCYHSIALLDMSDASVWIGGWRQKEVPVLHNTFHVGDQLLSINGDSVSSAAQAYKLIKQNTLLLEIIVRRVPYGRVFCIKRQREGQDLGLVREGNTGEIVGVVGGGLADRAGLNARAVYLDDECNWCLTEVNNRALSMFYKGSEIHDRLSAVGKEISILVQPVMFVHKLRKLLKQFKNYKEYIVQ
ncbi:uncharacterized protein LOC128952642, partial [Oppia nitens]|uniref:uncharacterized protein LOC128952642 n=1 Tax=Oppia nitens TaxID=1686743 RepID=UPI0023DA8C39